jgi:hypothetical protein
MGFVILVAGVGGLGTAIAYLIGPTERKLALMRPLSLAGIFAAICSFSVGVATVLSGVANTGTITADGVRMMLMGLSEAFIPLFAAFAFLSVAWLLVAAGMRRSA